MRNTLMEMLKKYAKSEKHLNGDAQHQSLHVVSETVHVHLLLVANHLSVSVFFLSSTVQYPEKKSRIG